MIDTLLSLSKYIIKVAIKVHFSVSYHSTFIDWKGDVMKKFALSAILVLFISIFSQLEAARQAT